MKNPLIIALACVGLAIPLSAAHASQDVSGLDARLIQSQPTLEFGQSEMLLLSAHSDRNRHHQRHYRSSRHHDDDDHDTLRYLAPLFLQGIFGTTQSRHYYRNDRECQVYYRGRYRTGTVSNRSGLCVVYYHGRTISFSNYRMIYR